MSKHIYINVCVYLYIYIEREKTNHVMKKPYTFILNVLAFLPRKVFPNDYSQFIRFWKHS